VIELRPYQLRAIAALRAAYARGREAVCLVLPTAGGKTVIAAEIIRLSVALGRRVLFVAHRTELINQTVAKLAAAGVLDVRVIQADRDDGNPGAPVIVGSVWTLTLPRWAELAPVDLIIVDECHWHASETFRRVTNRYLERDHRAGGSPMTDAAVSCSICGMAPIFRRADAIVLVTLSSPRGNYQLCRFCLGRDVEPCRYAALTSLAGAARRGGAR
jgi:hypothetical protein